MRQDRLQRWESMRRMGPLSFIAIYGVLFWGGFTALLFSLLMAWSHPVGGDFVEAFLAQASRAFVMFPIGGVLWAAVMWWLSERAYIRASGSRSD